MAESGGGRGFEIHIKYNNFLTRYDLDEIISGLDRQVENLLLEHTEFAPDIAFLLFAEEGKPILTYFGIKSVRAGSLIIDLYIAKEVLRYTMKHFCRGLDKSQLPKQLEKLAENVGNLLAENLAVINAALAKSCKNGRNVKSIVVKKTNRRKVRKNDRNIKSVAAKKGNRRKVR